MKKKNYLQPNVKVRSLLYSGNVCQALDGDLPATSGGSIDDGTDTWGKEADLDEVPSSGGYRPYSVWED